MSRSVFDVKGLEGYSVDVIEIPYNKDNHCYMAIDRDTNQCIVVDGGDPKTANEIIHTRKLKLVYVLTTHKHWDHSDGNQHWRKLTPDVPIIGSKYDQTPGANLEVGDGETLKFGNVEIKILHVPGHTSGHLSYTLTNLKSPNLHPVVFTGDFLFQAGCGRFFEGSPSVFAQSIEKFWSSHSDKWTKLFPGHDYNLTNLKFAINQFPNSQTISKRLNQTKSAQNEYFTTLNEELEINPFIRSVIKPRECFEELAIKTSGNDAVSILGELRKRKDSF